MKDYPKYNFFMHTFRERRALLYFIVFLVILITGYLYLFNHPAQPEYSIQPIEHSENNTTLSADVQKDNSPHHSINYKMFDPNQVSSAALKQMGVNAKAASNWEKYLAKGGRFKSARDLGKIYGLSQETIDLLTPYLSFAPTLQKNPEVPEVHKTVIAINPNEATQNQLMDIGLPFKAASNLIKYRSKGAKFYKSSDLMKVFGMTDSILILATPYLIFTSAPEPANLTISTPIDLNVADTTTLKKLPGLGTVLSTRIVRLRERLGGYYSLDQLQEVYNLPDSTINKIKSSLVLVAPVKKININSDSIQFLRHPYLNYKDALIIKSYIAQHGPIRGPQDLSGLLAFEPAFWKKLLPYLDFTLEKVQ